MSQPGRRQRRERLGAVRRHLRGDHRQLGHRCRIRQRLASRRQQRQRLERPTTAIQPARLGPPPATAASRSGRRPNPPPAHGRVRQSTVPRNGSSFLLIDSGIGTVPLRVGCLTVNEPELSGHLDKWFQTIPPVRLVRTSDRGAVNQHARRPGKTGRSVPSLGRRWPRVSSSPHRSEPAPQSGAEAGCALHGSANRCAHGLLVADDPHP